MKRFLIFTALVPPLALVLFNAPDVIMHHDFKLLSLTTLLQAYVVMIIPAWILAAVDGKFRTVAGTAFAGAAMAYLALAVIGFPFGEVMVIVMIGLIGAVPAAVSSWLSNRPLRMSASAT